MKSEAPDDPQDVARTCDGKTTAQEYAIGWSITNLAEIAVERDRLREQMNQLIEDVHATSAGLKLDLISYTSLANWLLELNERLSTPMK